MNIEPSEPATEILTAQQQLLKLSEEALGTELSPLDPVDDNVACADSMTNLLQKLYPNFPKVYHTADLAKALRNSPDFAPTMDIDAGNVWVNATGSGNGSIRGHAFVIGRDGRLHSNNSLTGLWDNYYTVVTARARYRLKGGMPTQVFRPI